MVLWCAFYALYVMYVFLGNYDPIFWYFQFQQNSRKWSPTNHYVKTIKNMKTECTFFPSKSTVPWHRNPGRRAFWHWEDGHSSWISVNLLLHVASNTSLGRSRSLPALGMGSGTASRWVFICFSCDFNVLFFMVGEPRFKVVFSPSSADECGFDVEFWKSCGLAFVFALKLC